MADKAVFKDYVETFGRHRSGTSIKQNLVEFFESEKAREYLDYGKHESLFSVGVGFGDLDAIVISKCVNLREYKGLEPDAGFHDKIRKNVGNRESLKVELIIDRFEDYEAPNESYDAVFFINCVSHFLEPEAQLRRGLNIVKKGGKMFVSSIDAGILFDAAKEVGMDVLHPMNIHMNEIAKNLEVNFKEIIIETDYECTGDAFSGALDTYFQNKASSEDKKKIYDILSRSFLPGTTKIPFNQRIHIFTK